MIIKTVFWAICVLLVGTVSGISIEEIEEGIDAAEYQEQDPDNILYIYAGIDYVPMPVIKLFEKVTGIKVYFGVFDSNEILEAKMLAGGTPYDIVFPTAFPNFNRQLKANIYQKIDVKLIDRSKFDAYVMSKLAVFDKGNLYCVPFQWGISGIGINFDIVKKILPANTELNSYALLFSEENIKKLSKCGVVMSESHEELFPAVAAYLGMNPEHLSEQDVISIVKHLSKIRTYIRKFTGYGFEDLSSKCACIAMGTSGDITGVMNQEIDINKRSSIRFILPKEGASLWIDVVAIPKIAKHVKNAHLFLKFLMHPKVCAYISNTTYRATAVLEAQQYIDKQLINNEYIYPTTDIKEKCYIETFEYGPINKLRTRSFTKIKSAIAKK